MLDVRFDEATLFLWRGIQGWLECVRRVLIVVVITPLSKVVRKFETSHVSSSILKVYDNKLFVLIVRL